MLHSSREPCPTNSYDFYDTVKASAKEVHFGFVANSRAFEYHSDAQRNICHRGASDFSNYVHL